MPKPRVDPAKVREGLDLLREGYTLSAAAAVVDIYIHTLTRYAVAAGVHTPKSRPGPAVGTKYRIMDDSLDPPEHTEGDPWPELPHRALPPRPRTRGECERGARPCPWVSCQHHLSEISTGSAQRRALRRADDAALDAMADAVLAMGHTCVLDVADMGGLSRETVTGLLGTRLSRQRIQQIEEAALLLVSDGFKVSDR